MKKRLLIVIILLIGVVAFTAYAQYEYEKTSPVYKQEDTEINFDDELNDNGRSVEDENVQEYPGGTIEKDIAE